MSSILTIICCCFVIGGGFGLLFAPPKDDSLHSALVSAILSAIVGGVVGVPVALFYEIHSADGRGLFGTDPSQEIDARRYDVVAIWRRDDCAADRLGGRLMADGRMTRNEYDRLGELVDRRELEAAKSRAAGSRSTLPCPTNRPSNQKDTTR